MGKIKQIFKHLNTRGFWTGLIAGFVYFGYIFWWFWSLYPLDSLGLQNKFVAGIIIFIMFAACVVIMAIFWGFFGYFSQKIIKKGGPAFIPLFLASTFTLTEFCRAVFFSIFWFGDGGKIGPYWPFGNIAYLLADLPLALTASIWGIYGIEFMVAAFFATLAVLILKKDSKKIIFLELAGIVIIIVGAIYLSKSSLKNLNTQASIPLAIIQTNTPSAGFNNTEESLEDFRKKISLLEAGAKEIGEGLIVLPEGTNFTKILSQFLDADGIEKYFRSLSKKELLIVDSLRVPDESDNFRSKAVFISSPEGLIGFYDKEILTPGGEFLPYLIKLPLTLIKPSLHTQFLSYREYSPGKGSNIIAYGDSQIKILICSEMISPVKANQGNGDFIVTIGSFSIWKGRPIIANQALAINRFRAIENGKYDISASNTGRSYIINPAGKIEKITSPNSYELLTGAIVPNKSQTWYNYVGDWPILLLSSVIFGLGLRKIRNDKTS